MNRVIFDPNPMTYSELYPYLLQKGLVVPRNLPPLLEPYLMWYNLNAHCTFHNGAPGHDLEGFFSLKSRVKELVMSKILIFRDIGSNVKNNPLLTHGAINVIT